MAAFFLIEPTFVPGLAATFGAAAHPVGVNARSVLRHTPATMPVARSSNMSVSMGGGGRRWWAHVTFTPINIELTISNNQIEELMNVQGVGEKNFLKLKSQLTVGTRPDVAGQQ